MFLVKAILAALVVWLSLCHVSPLASSDTQEEVETPSQQPAGETANGNEAPPSTPSPGIPPLPQPPLNACYDFVIVGAGSAGSVVANRLSASGKYTVLLLEAGGEPTEKLYVPFFSFKAANESNSWQYETVPQTNGCLSFKDRKAPMTQGKLLGGTSGINSMCYVRGNKDDFNTWNNTYGAKGWGFEDVLPYFKSIERFNVTYGNPNQSYHGFEGETPINYPNYNTSLSYSFLNACAESNYTYIDYNGATQYGYSRLQSNTENGARMSSYTCFLQGQVFARPSSLHISINSTVRKILFDEDKKVVGVLFTKNGEEMNVTVGRELILSAGAIGSPYLLLLSGIGPEEELRALNINVVANLSVGRGLQDHVVFLGLVVLTNKDYIGLADLANKSKYEYMINRTGLLTIPGAYEALLFTTTSNAIDKSHPDIKLSLTAVFPNEEIEKSPYVTEELYKAFYKPLIDRHETGFMNTITMGQPESRGTVKLNESNVYGPPLIDPNILSNENDINRTVNGILKLKSLFEQPSMRAIGAQVYNGTHPNCNFTPWSEDYVKCFLQNSGFPSMHVCCTCAMGNHSLSVVDERLKVKGGVKGLRIADGSVMPRITSGNTHAPIMMIGEKAAAMILEDAQAEEKKLMREIQTSR